MYKLLSAVAALAVLGIVGLFVAPTFVDWNAHRDTLEEALRDASGLDIDIAGDLDITFLPAPRVNAAQVVWTSSGERPSSIRIPSVRAHVALSDLIKGDFRLTDITLTDPEALLVVDRAGRPLAPAAPPGAGDGGGDGDAGSFHLDRVEVQGGTLTVQPQSAPESVIQVAGIDAVLTASQTGGRLNLKGSGMAGGQPLDYTASISRPRADRPVALRWMLALPDAAMTLAFDGALEKPTRDAPAAGKIDIDIDDLATLSQWLALPVEFGPGTGATLRGDIRLTTAGLAADGIDFSTEGARAKGTFDWTFGARPRVDTALHFSRINVDRISGPDGVDVGLAVLAFLDGLTRARASALPDELDLSVEATADAMQIGGGIVHGGRVSLVLEDGIAFLKSADALLPGGSDVALSGVLEPEGEALAFEGALAVTSDNLRALLDWAGVDAHRVPPARLRALELSGTLRSRQDTLALDDLRAALDATRASGRVALGFGDKPSFDVALAFDTFSVDAYRLRDTDRGDGDRPGGEPPNALAFLATADGTLALDFDKLIVLGQPLEKAALRGTLSDGVMQIPRLQVADYSGVTVDGSMLLSARAGQPQIGFEMSSRMRDPERFLRHLGLNPTAASRRLTGAALDLTGEGDVEIVTFTMGATLAGGTMTVDGAVAEPFGRADLTADIRANHPTPVQLVRAIGLPGLSTADTRRIGDEGVLRMAARARAAGDVFSMDIASLSVGDADLAGQANLDLTATRPVLDLVVIGSELSGAALLAALASVQRVTDVVLDLEADRLMLGRVAMEDARMRAAFGAAEATIGPVEGTILGGSALLTMDVKTEAGQDRMNGELVVQALDPGQLLGLLGGPPALGGTLGMTSVFSARGRTPGEYLASLAGQADIDGTIRIAPPENGTAAYATGLFGENLPPIQQVSELSSVLKSAFGDQVAPLEVSVEIANGIARTESATISGVGARATSYGSWDIAGERLELTLEVFRSAAGSDPYFVLGLAGPPLKPNVKIAGAWLRTRQETGR